MNYKKTLQELDSANAFCDKILSDLKLFKDKYDKVIGGYEAEQASELILKTKEFIKNKRNGITGGEKFKDMNDLQINYRHNIEEIKEILEDALGINIKDIDVWTLLNKCEVAELLQETLLLRYDLTPEERDEVKYFL